MVSPDTAVTIPCPPATVSVSVPIRTPLSVPPSAARSRVDEIAVEPALVSLPWASTVKFGIAVPDPYVFGVTAVLSRLVVTVPDVTTVVRAVPPANVSVSVLTSMLSVPVSPAISISLLSATAESTYFFVAASESSTGSATPPMTDCCTITLPDPFGSSTRLPLEFVVDIVLPFSVTLSTFNTSILLDASVIMADDAVSVPAT